MTDASWGIMQRDPQVLSKRLGEYVRLRTSAKSLAEIIGGDVRTAENIRQGHWPIARHWMGLVSTFGEDLTEAVFHPEKAAARLAREVQSLENELARKRADLCAVQGHRPCVAQASAAREDRTASRLIAAGLE